MSRVAVIIVGILAVLIILFFVVSAAASSLFNRQVKKEVKELFENNPGHKKEIVTKADLAGLPQCVQRWLERSQVIGKERANTVRLKQRGVMRLKEDQPWMPVEAEQYFTVDEPGFIWKARVRMNPLIYFAGKDKYDQGKGEMNIKVLSLIPVVNARGNEMDQGALLRYLAEMVWFPSAALNSYLKWEEIDANSARVTMSYQGVTDSGIYTFDDNGDIVSFFARRYREENGRYILTDWGGVTKGYNEFNGVRISSQTDVIWKLETGDFTWFQCEITDIEYNKPLLY